MPFCPNCRYEYKPEIWKCPDCGVRLVDELKEEEPATGVEEESAHSTEEECPQDTESESAKGPDFVRLRSLPSRVYAEMLQEALRRNGIISFIKDDDIDAWGKSCTTSPLEVAIWVPEDRVERCEEIADQMLDHI
jgi:hypothetical protein